jgi:transposase
VAASSNPDAATVMGSFDVVALAGVKLDLIRRRIHQQTPGRRGPYRRSALRHLRLIARTQLLSTRRGVPAGLEEIAQLGRTLWHGRVDVLAFFGHHASNGPTEAINGRLKALRRNALGFRNLTQYRWRSLLHSGALH